MSDFPGVKCDRCGVTALLTKGVSSFVPPDGWGLVVVTRGKPYLHTGQLDMCPTCITWVYEYVRKASGGRV